MSIDRWMDKEAVVHIYNGMLLSRKKEWSKSETEIEILYTDAYKWNLERWYWWVYLQGSTEETDIEKRPMDTGRGEEGEGEMHGGDNMETYFTICKIDSQWELAIGLRELK